MQRITVWFADRPLPVKIFLLLMGLWAVGIIVGIATASPQSKAIDGCVLELNDAANGAMSGGELEQICTLKCQRGELEGCQE